MRGPLAESVAAGVAVVVTTAKSRKLRGNKSRSDGESPAHREHDDKLREMPGKFLKSNATHATRASMKESFPRCHRAGGNMYLGSVVARRVFSASSATTDRDLRKLRNPKK